MDMKPGFKETEVGSIPENWEVAPLGELTDPKRPISYGIVQTGRSVPNGVKCLRVLDINGGRINKNDLITTTKEISDACKRTALRAGDLVMPLRGKVGDVAIVDHELTGCNLTRGVALLAIRSVWSVPFCQQFISSPATRTRLEQSMNGSALQEIPIATLRSFKIALPPTEAEQEAIAGALSDADILIESLGKLIAKKRQIKQGAVQELVHPKNDWVEKRLGNTAVLKARIGWQGLTTAEYLKSGDFYLVTGTDFKDGYVDWGNCHYVEKSRYRQDTNIQLRKRDVLITKDGTIGKVALVDRLDQPATLNSGVFVIRPIDDAFHPEFFYYLLCSNVFTEFLVQLSAGSTISHLYQKDFVNFIYKTPTTVTEQTTIAAILYDMDAEIAAFEAKLTKARQLKQGMMQELLTGRIRLV